MSRKGNILNIFLLPIMIIALILSNIVSCFESFQEESESASSSVARMPESNLMSFGEHLTFDFEHGEYYKGTTYVITFIAKHDNVAKLRIQKSSKIETEFLPVIATPTKFDDIESISYNGVKIEPILLLDDAFPHPWRTEYKCYPLLPLKQLQGTIELEVVFNIDVVKRIYMKDNTKMHFATYPPQGDDRWNYSADFLELELEKKV